MSKHFVKMPIRLNISIETKYIEDKPGEFSKPIPISTTRPNLSLKMDSWLTNGSEKGALKR